MGFGLDPSQARLATRTLFVLSAVLGSTVLISNYRTWRAKGGSTTSPGGVSRGQDLRSSLSQITSVLAASTILSGLLGFAGRKEILRVESVYASRTIIEIQGPSLGAAMVFVVLVGLASSLDALLTWRCYLTGRSIRAEDAPLAKWKSVLVHIYIWLLNLVYWGLSHAPTQVWMRTTPFHENLSIGDRGPGFYAALIAALSIFLLHLAVSASFIVVFMRSLHHLTEQVHVMDPQKVNDLRMLALKATVYCFFSLLLHLVCWGLFLIYPRNLQTDVSCTAYLLALLVLMELCFVVTLRLPARARAHANANAAPPHRVAGPDGSPQSAAVEMAAIDTNAAAADEVKEEDQQQGAAAAAGGGGGFSSLLSILSPRAASNRTRSMFSPREHLAHLTGNYTSQSLVPSSSAGSGPRGVSVSVSGLHDGGAGGVSTSSLAHYTTASSQAAGPGGSSTGESGGNSNSRGGSSSGRAASFAEYSPTRRRQRPPVRHWRELFSNNRQQE